MGRPPMPSTESSPFSRRAAHAAVSGIEFMNALRDFLDEEIAIAERAAGRTSPKTYQKISID